LAECSVEARGLVRRFGEILAVDNVSFCIRRGEIYSLLGPNGAGKTTTIRMLSTLLKPTRGDGYIMGHSVTRERGVVRRLIGLVPQELTADDELTGWDNVVIQARLYGMGKAEARVKAREVLSFMGLMHAAHRRVSTYSGGMRRRLEIAMSLIHDPPVVFMDEPTLGLDVQARRHLWDLIRKLRREGRTILLTTHYMEEAESLADRVAIMDRGRIVAEGTPEELKSAIAGDRIYIKPRNVSELELLVERLRSRGLEASVDGDTAVLKVKRAEDVLSELLQSIGAMPIAEFRIVKPNLEEVFLELTGRRLRGDEEALDSFKYRVITRRIRR